MHKPTLIMLPAFMCNEELFKDQVAKLSNFCNIIIPVLKEYNNITEAAKYVLSIAPKEFYLAGISMGGYIAMEMIKLSQDRIKKLCLMATKCEEDSESQKNLRLQGIQLVKSTNNVVATKSYLSSMLYNHSNSSHVYETIQKMNADLGSLSYINQQNLILSRNNFTNALKSFLKPTLIIAAEQDSITPPKLLTNIAQNISNSIYISINNCGHLIPLDQPLVLTALLEYFIKSQ